MTSSALPFRSNAYDTFFDMESDGKYLYLNTRDGTKKPEKIIPNLSRHIVVQDAATPKTDLI